MFEDRSYKRTFYSAPQSVTSLVAAFLEPTITVAGAAGDHAALRRARAASRPGAVPAGVRADLSRAATASGTSCSPPAPTSSARGWRCWASWRCAAMPRTACSTSTTTCCWPGPSPRRCCNGWRMGIGRTVLRRRAARPELRHSAIVVGAGPLGVKVALCAAGHSRTGARFHRLVRRPHRRAAGPRNQRPHAGRPDGRGALRPRQRHQRGLHHAAAGFAAAHPRAARRPARHDGVDLLRARRVRHQHHPGPAAGHERRAGGRHLRNALHRHQRTRQAAVATSCWPRSSWC